MGQRDKSLLDTSVAPAQLPEGVKVAAGRNDLWTVKVNAAPEASASGIVAVTVPETIMVPSKYMVGEPIEIAHRFFDDIGQLWQKFSQMAEADIRPGPATLALEILNSVRQIAPAVGISRNHDAYIALTAASELLFSTQQSKTSKQYYSHIFRSYVVSYTEEGAGLVSDKRGRVLTKDALRYLVLPSINKHGKFLSKRGTASVEGISDWARGHKVTPPDRVELGLEPMSEVEFQDRVERDLAMIAKIAHLSFKRADRG